MKNLVSTLVFALALLSACAPQPAPTAEPTEIATEMPTEAPIAAPLMLAPLTGELLEVGNIVWTNNSAEALRLSYVDLEGNEIEFMTLDPNTASEIGPAYFMGVNVVRDQSGNIVLVYVINGASDQKVTITADDVALAKTNGLTAFPVLATIPSGRQLPNNTIIANNSSQQVDIYSLDDAGNESLFATLLSGESTEAGPVYFGGMIIYKDATGKIVLVCSITEDVQQTCNYSAALEEFWATP
jgi:hypothetical protein